MKTLVTGCAGFIGSHLTNKLLEQGHNVVGIDCFRDYYPRAVKEHNLRKAKKYQEFELIEKDILEVEVFPEVDVVFHLAAQPGVRASCGKSFDIYTRDNIEATQRLLEAYKEQPLEKFVYASSSSIYGNVKVCSEANLPRPESPYGVTKLAGEHLCQLYQKNYGVPTVILRYFTVYGPRQRPDEAIHKFVEAALLGKEIEIYGDGEQARDFTYVGDVIRVTLASIEFPSGTIVNVGGGNQISVNKLLEVIARLTSKELKVRYIQPQKGDVRDTLANTAKLIKLLGWKPTIPLEVGLTTYISEVQKQLVGVK